MASFEVAPYEKERPNCFSLVESKNLRYTLAIRKAPVHLTQFAGNFFFVSPISALCTLNHVSEG